jgi:hypothetical protein
VHVFLSRERRGPGLAAAGRALDRRLVDLAPTLAIALGDPFPLGSQLPPRTRSELAASFGEGFAGAVEALESGRWSGPIASSYGLHRVYVQERTPGRAARLEEVRSILREEIFAERAEAVLAEWLRRLRNEAA